MSAMLQLVVCSLSLLAAPAQLHVIETIFEHGIKVKESNTSLTRFLSIPRGTCNITLYPSHLVCTNDNPYPYWLQIKVVDLKMAVTSVTPEMLEVRVRRRGMQRDSIAGACATTAKVYLTGACGAKLITRFDKWEFTPMLKHHGPRIEY